MCPLNIYEILECTVAQIDSQRTLVSLAQSCRAYSIPALERLWSAFPVPAVALARCMPEEYWADIEWHSSSNMSRYCRQLVLLDCVLEGDWLGERFRRRAAHIRNLTTLDFYFDPLKYPIRTNSNGPVLPNRPFDTPLSGIYLIHPLVISAWHASGSHNTPLFPRLECLEWCIRGSHDAELVGPFLGPDLTRLKLQYPSNDSRCICAPNSAAELIMLRAALARLSLVSLQFEIRHVSESVFRALGEVNLENLEEFRLSPWYTPVTAILWKRLVTLPHLRTLCINLEVNPPNPLLDQQELAVAILPSLCALSINGIRVSQATTLLGALNSTSIHTLALSGRYDNEPQTGHLASLLDSIANCASSHAIKNLTLHYGPDRNNDGDYCEANIIPLLTLRAIEQVDIGWFNIDQKITPLSSMLRAWPNLETFHKRDTNQIFTISLEDFADSLCSMRSHLKSLIKVQVECLLDSPLPKTKGLQFPNITTFDLSVQLNEDVLLERAPLAHYLINTFPNANFIRYRSMWGDPQAALLVNAADNARRNGIDWSLRDYRAWEANFIASQRYI